MDSIHEAVIKNFIFFFYQCCSIAWCFRRFVVFELAGMTPQWENGFGMGAPAPAPAPAYIYGLTSGAEMLRVDELLDFTHHDLFSSSSSSSSSAAADASLFPAAQFVAAADISNSEYHHPRHASFADDIFIPSDEVAELEWLSKFVEDSFSDVPVQSLAAESIVPSATIHRADVSTAASVRGARSKRPRNIIATAAAESAGVNHSAWSSLTPSSSTTSSSSSSDFPTTWKKEGSPETAADGGGLRRCTHCASEKTPQWRTGPLGPKTLCNACGVRFKSGRLVPEYRPAASPTFVLTQHSNSHRKVMELRRQKELLVLRRQDNATGGGTEMLYHDYDAY